MCDENLHLLIHSQFRPYEVECIPSPASNNKTSLPRTMASEESPLPEVGVAAEVPRNVICMSTIKSPRTLILCPL